MECADFCLELVQVIVHRTVAPHQVNEVIRRESIHADRLILPQLPTFKLTVKNPSLGFVAG